MQYFIISNRNIECIFLFYLQLILLANIYLRQYMLHLLNTVLFY